MALEDDDERHLERLRELGLLHLADRPAELHAELARRVAERDRLVDAYERERAEADAPPTREPAPPDEGGVGRPAAAPTRPTQRAEGPAPLRRKSSTLLVLTKTGGPCRACRHANLGTVDHQGGHVFCWLDKRPKTREQKCDFTLQLPRSRRDAPASAWGAYFAFEPHDGQNGTYGVGEDYRALAVDADHEIQEQQQFSKKVIPGEDL